MLSRRIRHIHFISSSIIWRDEVSGPIDITNGSDKTCEVDSLARQYSMERMERLPVEICPQLTGSTRTPTGESMASMSDEIFQFQAFHDTSTSLIGANASQRGRFIDKVINWMVTWVDSRLAQAAFQAPYGSSSHSKQPITASASTPEKTSGLSPKNVRNQNTKRKRKDDEEEDDPNQMHGGSAARSDDTNGRMFACPFFQHDPLMMPPTLCAITGWPSVPRLKYEIPPFSHPRRGQEGWHLMLSCFNIQRASLQNALRTNPL